MAGKELFCRDGFGDGCAGGGIGLPGREENIGGRDQKDVVLIGLALRWEGAFEEGGEEWV